MIKYLGHRTWVPKCSSYSVYRGQLSLLSQWTPNWQLSPMYSTSVVVVFCVATPAET